MTSVSFSDQWIQQFSPFPEGFIPRDAGNFKNSFIGMEDVLFLSGRSLSDQVRKHIDMGKYAERALLVKRMEGGEDLESKVSELDRQIDRGFEKSVSDAFDLYLSRRSGSKKVQDRVKALFSSKPFTSMMGQFNRRTTEKFGGMFMNPNTLNQRCELFFPNNSKDPIRVVAQVKLSFSQFHNQEMGEVNELKAPVTLDAQSVFFIDRKGKTSAVAGYLLKDSLDLASDDQKRKS